MAKISGEDAAQRKSISSINNGSMYGMAAIKRKQQHQNKRRSSA